MFDLVFSEMFAKITSLALADSVNPCEIAILTMILLTILIKNPDNKRKVLYAGLAFSASVLVGYLFYGTILVTLFKEFAQVLRENAIFVHQGLAVLAMIIGALNIKDYFFYEPGGIATEMPKTFRPYAKLTINKITSPAGAFFIGFVVTLFLLPCTMGPYIVASGLLSELSIASAVAWLVYYNIIFILPMLIITMIVYLGFSKIEDVSGWKERNIKRLHLIAGTLLFLTGVALLAGWI